LLKQASLPHLRRVINATGVILHTNLGRAVLSQRAIDAVARAAGSYSNLELDLASGERGSRYSHVEELLCKLTGAEAALVVNNNAGAVLLALSSMAAGREVVVSRGQLVEIGGAFRIPEVMAQSGCILKEVGSTNKTHLRDYENAISENTALLLKVHTSNYRVVGFTAEVGLPELVKMGNKYNIPVIEDMGSGFLVDLQGIGIGDEPTVQASIAAGAQVVTFSGDKLLGGPQAGIIVGEAQYIAKMKKHPLTRAVRIDKLTLAALEATLWEYIDQEEVLNSNPTLKMLKLSKEELAARAEELSQLLHSSFMHENSAKAAIEITSDYSQVGGGAMPLTQLPTWVVKVHPYTASVQSWAESLRNREVPVIVRVADDSLIFDPRTLLPGDVALINEAIRQISAKE
ncbi:MAG TPA: L-seryl-tRNA(Sec) selenium transferase, partial [Bacillota bacterium]|nr:L-seryl-tRNA(Sec) selenium transferase [Bacillota bacterium]